MLGMETMVGVVRSEWGIRLIDGGWHGQAEVCTVVMEEDGNA